MKKLLLFSTIAFGCFLAKSQTWNLIGNAGTIDNTNFIGTTDNRPLNFRINNQRSARIDTANVFMGYRAGGNAAGITTKNTALGAYTLFSNTSGNSNTAIGSYALHKNTTGNENVANGYSALFSNITGSRNVANGLGTLINNTEGNENVASGYQALYSNTIGSYNVACGTGALYANVEGNENTAIGSQALSFNTMGNQNVAIGTSALRYNKDGVLNVAVGSYALYSNMSGFGNVANGCNALYNNISGNLNIAIGDYALYSNNTGYRNVANGNRALFSNVNGIDNIAIGDNALYNNNASGNIGIGTSTLQSNTTGWSNIAIGETVLFDNTTGGANVGIGGAALRVNTTGSNNIAIGHSALYRNKTGSHNVANGITSLTNNETGSYNIASGTYTLRLNTSGEHNVAIGYAALDKNTTGNWNVGVGSFALYTANAGTFNTGIGYCAGGSSALSYTNTTALGSNAPVTANNQVRVGDNSVKQIGGAVNWSVISDGRFKANIREDVPGLKFIENLRTVTYNYKVDELNQFVGIPDSIRNLKTFAQAAKEKSEIRYSGLIAQEVEKAAEKIGYDFSGVHKPQSDKDSYGIAYAELVVPLIKAVQELNQSNEKQRAINEQLIQQIAKLQSEMTLLQQSNRLPSSASKNIIGALTVYPNPTNEGCNVQIPGTGEKVLVIYDVSGRHMNSMSVSGGKVAQIRTQSWVAGSYQLTLLENKQLVAVGKIIKE